MERTKKLNPYLIGGVVVAALVAALLATRGTRDDDGDPPSRADTARVGATQRPGPSQAVRFKIPVTDLHAWLGPNDALVTMVEWCDLRGPACRGAEAPLKELMKEYEGKLRWVHYSVADSSRPDEAKRIHQFARAVYEDEKDSVKFWKVRESLLATPDATELGDAELRRVGREVGVDYDKLAPQIRDGKFGMVVALDMGLGARFGVRQLPAIYVNGRPVPPTDSPRQLARAVKVLIEEELVHARELLAQGVEPSRLYEKIVEGGLWSLDDNPETRRASALGKSRRSSLKFDEP